MLGKLRRVAVPAVLAWGTVSTVWYTNQDSATQLLAKNRLIGLTRALRTGFVWARLVVEYKYLIWSRPLDDEKFKANKLATHERGAQLVLRLCEKNGGLFVKMGQHASSLRPAIPDAYIETLTLLQDRAPARDVNEIVSVLKLELDASKVEELIEGIDPKPLGSASLAQVHKCTLRNGKQVALKVQHFNLENILESDLIVIKFLDWAATQLFSESEYSLAWAVREFETNLKQELDFSREASNGSRMRQLILSHPWLKTKVEIPEVDFSRSSRRVLCYEFADGYRIRECPEAIKPVMAETVVRLFAAMIFSFGFVHCDPHFGNFLIRHGDNKLVLLDHGLYREMDEGFVKQNALLWRAMVANDVPQIHAASRAMGCDKYKDLFPLMLTNRPVNSTAKLGEAIPKSELQRARKLSGFESGMSLAQFTQIAEGVPVDMLFVLRTMHLVKDLHVMLGGTNRERFLHYANAATCAPEVVPPRWFSGAQFRLVQFHLRFALFEKWVDLKRWLAFLPGKETGDSRFSLSQMLGEKMDNALSGAKKRRGFFWERSRTPPAEGGEATKMPSLWSRVFHKRTSKREGEEVGGGEEGAGETPKLGGGWKRWFQRQPANVSE